MTQIDIPSPFADRGAAREPRVAHGAPRRARGRSAARTAGLLAALAAMSLAAPRPAAGDEGVSDAAVDAAITRAVAWLKSQRGPEGIWETEGSGRHPGNEPGGDTALAVLALLYAGENPRQDDMARSLQWLTDQTLTKTYTVATRAHALALIPGQTYRAALQKDVDWLLKAVGPRGTPAAGAYRYTMEQAGNDYDHSASQFGVLGLWMAADAGMRVPDDYWTLVEEHWLAYQTDDGGWSYQGKGTPTGSMSAAGLATLFVCLDKGHARDEGTFNGTSSPLCGDFKRAEALIAAIDRALNWFATHFTPEQNPGGGGWRNYYLYGVERIGRASGRKYFRDRDWFKLGAALLLKEQTEAGSWTSGDNELHDTCFALMFLCHGRAPMLFNKLRHGEDWNNKLRDVANLTRYAERRLERLLNWQIVHLDGPIADLLEAPLLYMSGHTAWEFSDEQVDKLREYCNRGGMLLGVACCSRPEFDKGFRALVERLYPQFPLAPVPDDRELIGASAFAASKDPPPRLMEVHNGVRTLVLYSPQDICAPWNQNRLTGKFEDYFALGANIYLYATDRTSVRSRLETVDLPLRQVPVRRTIRVARIRYEGKWDPEPYGWVRLGHYLNNETGSRLEVEPGLTWTAPELGRFQIAHMTGSTAFTLSDEELKGLRQFVLKGGTLIADAAGGSRAFEESFEKAIRDALKQDMVFLQRDSFMLSGAGIPDAVSLDGIGYRRTARREGRGHPLPRIRAVELANRLAVLFVPMDISAGLLGTHIFDCRGYDAESCLRIARNLLLYASLSVADKARLARH